jgi:hypothetical protein
MPLVRSNRTLKREQREFDRPEARRGRWLLWEIQLFAVHRQRPLQPIGGQDPPLRLSRARQITTIFSGGPRSRSRVFAENA